MDLEAIIYGVGFYLWGAAHETWKRSRTESLVKWFLGLVALIISEFL